LAIQQNLQTQVKIKKQIYQKIEDESDQKLQRKKKAQEELANW
jgi:hypothetical protein